MDARLVRPPMSIYHKPEAYEHISQAGGLCSYTVVLMMIFRGLAEAEVVAEGYGEGHVAGCAECVGLGGGEDVAEAVVVAGFEVSRVARTEIELNAEACADAVVEFVVDRCGKLLGHAGFLRPVGR